MMTIVRLGGLLRPYWKYLLVALLATLGDAAAGLLQPWPLKLVFDNVLQAKQQLPPVLAHLGHVAMNWLTVGIFGREDAHRHTQPLHGQDLAQDEGLR